MATSFQLSPLTFHKLVREQHSSQPSLININFYDASCFFIVVFKACTKIRKRFSYRFSAFWLRSCVVFVLVKLISGIAGHSLAPILNWFLLPELTPKLASVDSRIVPGLTLPSGAVHLKILNLQITSIEWRCQYEESNWDWWIAANGHNLPKKLKDFQILPISIVRTIVKSWGIEKMNQFRRTSSKLWVLESSVMPKKLSLIERGAKKRKFQNFCYFLSKFYFFNIVSQFWTQNNSNELKTTSLASVFVE